MKKTNENNEAASCEIKREGDEDYTKIEKAGNGFPYVICAEWNLYDSLNG